MSLSLPERRCATRQAILKESAAPSPLLPLQWRGVSVFSHMLCVEARLKAVLTSLGSEPIESWR
jgi:hypothetical protein